MKTGLAFGDHIKFEKVKHRKYEYSSAYRSRWILLLCFLAVVLCVLSVKLFSLQFFRGSYFRSLSDSNRTRTEVIHAPRGVIFDRNGVPLVFNIPGFKQVITDPHTGEVKKSVHLSKDQALLLLSQGVKNITVDSLREYPERDVFADIVGYIGQISPNELSQPEFSDYRADDWVGKDGIEQTYEHTLRGKDGNQLIEVDAMGKKVRSLGQTDPIPGQDVTLTVDTKLQQAVYDATKEVKAGAVIVSKPDGEVLALVSRPSYDPNLFTLDSSYKVASDSAYRTVGAILTDGTGQPLLNRAIAGEYPPGSTFKIVVSAAGLQDKVIDENFAVNDSGVLTVGKFSFANWLYTEYGRTEKGGVNVVRALARSNDIFFYKLAELLDIPKLSEMARSFGLGKLLGIDLPGESRGVVPTKEWKKQQIKEPWYLGDTYQYGIGQGFLLTTPLQVNAWTQVIANGGTLYQPRLNLHQSSRVLHAGFLDAKTITTVREGMIEACAPGGVAYPFYNYGVNSKKLGVQVDGKDFYTLPASVSAQKNEVGMSVACKTGTAQHGGDNTLPHAWITLFAPAYHPQVVVTVLVESGGEGSSVAGPIAKKILDAYFDNSPK
jgi:penicillin-binding protein 2